MTGKATSADPVISYAQNLGFDGKLHWFHFSDSEYFVDVGISTGHMQAYNK